LLNALVTAGLISVLPAKLLFAYIRLLNDKITNNDFIISILSVVVVY
jgi:hypothetical protein